MTRDLHADMLSETLASVLMPCGFVEIDTPSGNVYLWLGGLGSIDWDGHSWVGAGRALAVSAITEAVGAQANGVTGRLSGIDTDNIELVFDNLRRYMPVKMWIGALDENLDVVDHPYQVFNGRVDSASADQDGKTATIEVSAENRLITLDVARERRYTDQDQRIERPYDGGFKTVDSLQDANTQWNGLPTQPVQQAASMQAQTGGPWNRLRLGRSV